LPDGRPGNPERFAPATVEMRERFGHATVDAHPPNPDFSFGNSPHFRGNGFPGASGGHLGSDRQAERGRCLASGSFLPAPGVSRAASRPRRGSAPRAGRDGAASPRKSCPTELPFRDEGVRLHAAAHSPSAVTGVAPRRDPSLVDVLAEAAERGFHLEERPLRGSWVWGWRRGDDTRGGRAISPNAKHSRKGPTGCAVPLCSSSRWVCVGAVHPSRGSSMTLHVACEMRASYWATTTSRDCLRPGSPSTPT
jgi:hypothetical protein